MEKEDFQNFVQVLSQNQIPLDPETNEPISVISPKFESLKLTDDDVEALCEALAKNDVFEGCLNLSGQELSDQAALFVSELIQKNSRIRGLDISENKFSEKAGIFIGEALKNQDNYDIKYLVFKGNYLQIKGIRRICEFLSLNHNIEHIAFGKVSDEGLKIINEFLNQMSSLKSIHFEEDPKFPWENSTKEKFISCLKDNSSILDFDTDITNTKLHENFSEECKYFTKSHQEQAHRNMEFEERNKSLNINTMFNNCLELIAQKRGENMPVQQFYTNTFGKLISDALYELERKRFKYPNHKPYFKVKGSIKFIATYLLSHLPKEETKLV